MVLLAGPGASTRILYHALAARGRTPTVILEAPVPRSELLGRRVRRFGLRTVAGQVAFGALVTPLLRRRAAARVLEILTRAGLRDAPLEQPILRVASVNSAAAREALAALAPRVVVVSGTRIIQPETLAAGSAPFLNLHAGLTPGYRGVHGGYWALVEGRPEEAGVTLHFVDRGVDTGAIVAQEVICPGPDDSFVTYPYLQLAAGIPRLLETVDAILGGAEVRGRVADSRGTTLRTHPTIGQYLYWRWRRGVR